MLDADDTHTWQAALEGALAPGGPLSRAIVLDETDSTQDAARRLAARPGDVIVAGRQVKGRGRRGRPWADTQAEGVAMTAVIERNHAGHDGIIAAAAAVAAARAAGRFLPAAAGIKWPNDVMVDGRKLAGILVEVCDERVLIGVGMNVAQRRWPRELAHVAVSLAECGACVSRLEVMKAIAHELNDVLRWPREQVVAAFREHDVLRGTLARFRCGERVLSGLVRSIEPDRGITIDADGEHITLPAATTSVLKA